MPLDLVKSHAYGNDFLLVPGDQVRDRDPAELARALCDRQTGVGADGVILFRPVSGGAEMRLLNADGSRAEVSGNGVRCLAAWLLESGLVEERASSPVVIRTEAGEKRLWPLGRDGRRRAFRAEMGQPTDLAERRLRVGADDLTVVTLRVGNPQCVVLGEATDDRLHQYGLALATHPAFPEGSNVEFVSVEAPGVVRMVIWERGVGPTLASGTGACAAAVAAMAYGGAARAVDVVAPGGTQHVEWRDDGIYLTGWAAVILEGRWLAGPGDRVTG